MIHLKNKWDCTFTLRENLNTVLWFMTGKPFSEHKLNIPSINIVGTKWDLVKSEEEQCS